MDGKTKRKTNWNGCFNLTLKCIERIRWHLIKVTGFVLINRRFSPSHRHSWCSVDVVVLYVWRLIFSPLAKMTPTLDFTYVKRKKKKRKKINLICHLVSYCVLNMLSVAQLYKCHTIYSVTSKTACPYAIQTFSLLQTSNSTSVNH